MSVMYIASGIHWSVNVYTFMREIRDPVAWAALPIEDIYRWSVITAVALFYNVSMLRNLISNACYLLIIIVLVQ